MQNLQGATWFKLTSLIPFVQSLLGCQAVIVYLSRGLSDLFYAQTPAVKMKATNLGLTLTPSILIGRDSFTVTWQVNKTHLVCKNN